MQQKVNALLSGFRKRFAMLYYYVVKGSVRRRTSPGELLFHLFSPNMHAVAREQATVIREDDRYTYYEIKGYRDEFIYPVGAPYYSLAMILSESRPAHWHYYEIPQTAVAVDDVVVDCGSAEGFFTFRHQYTASRIFALEPLPMFIEALHRQFGGSDRVTILPVAAGDSCHRAYIQQPAAHTALDATVRATGDEHSISIEVVTLDSLFADKGIKIDYLKADIEGYEEPMIRGALETIRMSRPKIAVTTYHKGQDYQRLIDMIRGVVPEYNYKIKGIDYLSGNPVMLHMWI